MPTQPACTRLQYIHKNAASTLKCHYYENFGFGLGLVLGLGLGLALRLELGLELGFDPSSLIVRELVLSLKQLSFPLVRFRHNHAKSHLPLKMISPQKLVSGLSP